MAEVCVAHLVRAQNGVEPFRAFMDSYRQHEAGREHVLLLIFKGFEQTTVPEAFREVVQGVPNETLFVADEGFDIGAYFAAAERFDFAFFCFLNSFSLILDAGWLAKMYRYVIQKEVGIVGATASCESHYSNALNKVQPDVPKGWSPKSVLRPLVRYYFRQKNLRPLKEDFDAFPNYHMRTNAFMISRTLMLSLERSPLLQKADAERFESGKRGLTRQIYARGLRALVVGRDGKAYDKEQWSLSRTFRSGHEENLLVADNRTQQYLQAGEAEQKEMQQRTWGKGHTPTLVPHTVAQS